MPTVAIIGASSDRSKFGNKAVRAYAKKGYTVYPVHPTASEIEGHPCFTSIEAVPVESLDRVSVYLPPEVGLQVLENIAKKQAASVWLNPGAESAELLAKANELDMSVICGCSIVDLGMSPEMFP